MTVYLRLFWTDDSIKLILRHLPFLPKPKRLLIDYFVLVLGLFVDNYNL